MRYKIIIKECKKHGEVDHALTTKGSYICKQCRVEWTTNKRKRIKINLVKCHGDKCNICGYDKCITALQFHHIDPSQKDFNIAKAGGIIAFNKAIEETKKCILVCSNCHSEIHAGINKTKLKSSFIDNFFIKEKKINKCKKCSCEIKKHRMYCESCFDNKSPRFATRKVIRPSLIVLETEVLNIGYCATGRKYGVTDNTIRKWINYYKNNEYK